MKNEEIKVNVKEYEKQLFDEIISKDGSMDIRVAVPEITTEKIEEHKDLGIYSYIHAHKVNPITTAMTVLVLEQMIKELKKEPMVKLALMTLKMEGQLGEPEKYAFKKEDWEDKE